MNTAALTYFILITLAVVLFSWRKVWGEKKAVTIEGHFLGNRSLGWVMVGGLLFLTNVNGFQFVGENEAVYLDNMAVMAWGMTSVVAMFIVSEFFMPRYLCTGVMSTPEFLGHRFDEGTSRFVSVVFMVGYVVNMLPVVLYGGAVVLNGMFRFSDHFSVSAFGATFVLVWIIGLIGSIYSLFGGLRVMAMSDALLGGCLFIVGLCLPWFGLKVLGDGSFSAGLNVVLSSETEHFNAIGSADSTVPFSTIFTGMLLVNLYYWGMEQYIVQWALASRDLASSQKGYALAAFGKIICPFMLNVPGVIAVHLYPEIENSAEIFPRMTGNLLPPVLTGLAAAVIFGAALTAFNAGLNSISTLFAMNVYKPWKEKRQLQGVPEARLVLVGKRFSAVAALFSLCVAPFLTFAKGGFYNYIQLVGSFFSVPVFTVLVVGFLTKRVPALAAKIGLAFFVSAYVLTQLVFDTGLHFLHVSAILFVLTVGIMLFIGKIHPLLTPWRAPEQQTVELVAWRWRHIAWAFLLMLMVGMYILFSPLGIAK